MESVRAWIPLIAGLIFITTSVLGFVKRYEQQLSLWLTAAPSLVGRVARWPVRAALRLMSLPWVRSVILASLPIIVFSGGVGTAGLGFGAFLLVDSDDGPPVRIISLSEGDEVPREISVEIEARPESDAEFVCVFVRPLPGDPNHDYWPQQFPQPRGEDRWEATPVYVGVRDDRPGTPFNICAVLRPSCPSVGEPSRVLPAGPSDCVLVARE